ncbi:muscular LMNA-interacting protein isoform X2 [Sphaeramia orbicularis]|uniref:Uncharacterized protein n=1 Tax=Sphaeramia orbicularis TaxID=375764 RepID=A0A673B3H0_9TELE|nr:muscular LMNA-interacting protein isoform X2 [Sphaeramia orbicularis]
MDSVDKSLGKVSIGVPSKPCAFTFVPVVQSLPIKNSVTVEEASTVLSREPHKNLTASHEETGETMSEGEVFKAVFIKDFSEGGEENVRQTEGKLQLMPALDHVSPAKSSPSVSAQSENTPNTVTSRSDLMETAVDKHGGISQRRCHNAPGRGGEPHKIKSSYKSLAAIPTNTLLLDQQAIDEQIERGEGGPCDGLEGSVTSHSLAADTHAEMCSPAQLRQQSEELYAVIDEILGKTILSESSQTSRASTINTGVQSNSTFPRSCGRETKYASLCSLSPSTSVDRKVRDFKKTKPGVIRPKTAIPRLTVESEEKNHGNPFRPSSIKQTLPDNTKGVCASLEEILKDFTARSKGQTLSAEGKPAAFSACALQITEAEDQISHPFKDGSRLLPPTSFTPAGGKMETFETHI